MEMDVITILTMAGLPRSRAGGGDRAGLPADASEDRWEQGRPAVDEQVLPARRRAGRETALPALDVGPDVRLRRRASRSDTSTSSTDRTRSPRRRPRGPCSAVAPGPGPGPAMVPCTAHGCTNSPRTLRSRRAPGRSVSSPGRERHAPQLLVPVGIGSDGAVTLLDTEASFAALRGVGPIEYSSGRRRTRRFNHGGDRQASAALHRIVFTRPRHAPRPVPGGADGHGAAPGGALSRAALRGGTSPAGRPCADGWRLPPPLRRPRPGAAG
ncbi:transposase [Streptomyces sp. YIM B13518]|uniref:transposase n=1 Tax=Streptomyces sp. YIM B13518 TaxID=3366316 RepID=UPI0036A92739